MNPDLRTRILVEPDDNGTILVTVEFEGSPITDASGATIHYALLQTITNLSNQLGDTEAERDQWRTAAKLSEDLIVSLEATVQALTQETP